MTSECYKKSCRHHSVHVDGAEDNHLCCRAECSDRPVLRGEIRSCRTQGAVSPWRVWDGARWVRCWTPLGAALTAKEIKQG